MGYIEDIQLLTRAFEAQRENHSIAPIGTNIGYGTICKSGSFEYSGPLPSGITKLGRREAWEFGAKEPEVYFDRPLDTQRMSRALRREFFWECVFGKIEIVPWDTKPEAGAIRAGGLTIISLLGPEDYEDVWILNRVSNEKRDKLLTFGSRHPTDGNGRLLYYTDGYSTQDKKDTGKIIRAIAMYLEPETWLRKAANKLGFWNNARNVQKGLSTNLISNKFFQFFKKSFCCFNSFFRKFSNQIFLFFR